MDALRQEYRAFKQSYRNWKVALKNHQVNSNEITKIELDQANEDFERRSETIGRTIDRMKARRLYARLSAALNSHEKSN